MFFLRNYLKFSIFYINLPFLRNFLIRPILKCNISKASRLYWCLPHETGRHNSFSPVHRFIFQTKMLLHVAVIMLLDAFWKYWWCNYSELRRHLTQGVFCHFLTTVCIWSSLFDMVLLLICLVLCLSHSPWQNIQSKQLFAECDKQDII